MVMLPILPFSLRKLGTKEIFFFVSFVVSLHWPQEGSTPCFGSSSVFSSPKGKFRIMKWFKDGPVKFQFVIDVQQ